MRWEGPIVQDNRRAGASGRRMPAANASQPQGLQFPLFRVPPLLGLLLTIPLSLIEALLALDIQPGELSSLLEYFETQQPLGFLNILPFWLLTVVFYFLFSDPFFAAALVGCAGGLLSLVNRTMLEKRDEPLSPKDFGLIKEAGDALKSYGLSVDLPSLLFLIGFVLLAVLLGLLFRGRRPFKNRWFNLGFAVAGAAAAFGVLVGCVLNVYDSKELYDSFPVDKPFYTAGVYNQLCFPYCFCHNFTTHQVEKPDGYSSGEAASYAKEYPEEEGGKNVNVIMVMNESFSDVTDFETFDYTPEEDPLRFYHSLQNSDRALTGHIVVPNFGAGTANTEFDVLTGMQTNMISQNETSAFRVLHGNTDSVFRAFLEDGYQTEFIHPGQSWFYNRQNVYKYFGAEKLLFSEAFEDAERKGSWVTDNAVLQTMKEEFEAAMREDKPYFNYTVTIQNHMSYTADKYGDEYKLSGMAPLKKEMAPGVRTMLSVYAEGVRDADAMLQGLTEYYDTRKEPVLLVFFGDHLPNLGDDYFCYKEMGFEIGESDDPQTTLRTYETPYVIWANQAAEKELNFTELKNALDLPDDNTINAHYLGALTLEITGRRNTDSYFSFLSDLRRELPVLHNGTGRGGDGEYFTELPEEYAEDVRKLQYWEYYKLK